MWRCLPLMLLLTACSNGAEADLQYIGQARSLAAEWAMVNEQEAQGKLTQAYVDSMHRQLRQQLQAASTSLTRPNSAYAADMVAVLHARDVAAPAQLRAHAERLRQIEDSLESA
jgi:Tfp pilus assembly protein PilP